MVREASDEFALRLSTDTGLLVKPGQALFAPYVATTGSYKCPADRSTVSFAGRQLPRVRSYCMNVCLGSQKPPGVGKPERLFLKTVSELNIPTGQSRLLVFVEAHEVTITSPQFSLGLLEQLDGVDYDGSNFPAGRHGGSAVLSFADGHVEVKRWLDARTRNAVERRLRTPHNPDLWWLVEQMYDWRQLAMDAP